MRIPIADSLDRREFCVKTGLNRLKSLPGYPNSELDPVFNIFEGNKWVPLCKKALTKFLKSHLDFLRLDSTLVTPSSFRKGGLSHMLLKVGNMELLRLQGDWMSEAYKRYIVIPADQRFAVTKQALQNMPT